MITISSGKLSAYGSEGSRLYEQEPPNLKVRRLGEYLRQWHGWALSGGWKLFDGVHGGRSAVSNWICAIVNARETSGDQGISGACECMRMLADGA
jgi:hypothetical protein